MSALPQSTAPTAAAAPDAELIRVTQTIIVSGVHGMGNGGRQPETSETDLTALHWRVTGRHESLLPPR